MIEIERKYLLKNEGWRVLATNKARILQGYIPTGKLGEKEETSVRIRMYGAMTYIAFKGRGSEDGVSRFEIEKPIELNEDELQALLKRCTGVIEKIRYIVPHHKEEGLEWEIDEFLGSNDGLIVAEIEFEPEDRVFALPNWIGDDVTDDPKYLNVNLATNPFSTW